MKKLIDKLIKQAEQIDGVDAPPEQIKPVTDLEAFSEEEGVLYYIEKTKTLFKKQKTTDPQVNIWLKFNYNPQMESGFVQEPSAVQEPQPVGAGLPQIGEPDPIINDFNNHKIVQDLEEAQEKLKELDTKTSSFEDRLATIEKGYKNMFDWSHKLMAYLNKQSTNLTTTQNNVNQAMKDNIDLKIKQVMEECKKLIKSAK